MFNKGDTTVHSAVLSQRVSAQVNCAFATFALVRPNLILSSFAVILQTRLPCCQVL